MRAIFAWAAESIKPPKQGALKRMWLFVGFIVCALFCALHDLVWDSSWVVALAFAFGNIFGYAEGRTE